jgi:hypothetical protein
VLPARVVGHSLDLAGQRCESRRRRAARRIFSSSLLSLFSYHLHPLLGDINGNPQHARHSLGSEPREQVTSSAFARESQNKRQRLTPQWEDRKGCTEQERENRNGTSIQFVLEVRVRGEVQTRRGHRGQEDCPEAWPTSARVRDQRHQLLTGIKPFDSLVLQNVACCLQCAHSRPDNVTKVR